MNVLSVQKLATHRNSIQSPRANYLSGLALDAGGGAAAYMIEALSGRRFSMGLIESPI